MFDLVSVLFMLVIVGIWVTAAFLPLIALLCYLTNITGLPLYLLIAYYTYRFVVPRRRWDPAHQLSIWCSTHFSYYRTQKIIYEDEDDTTPVEFAPASRNLIAFAPHGITCNGFGINGGTDHRLYDSNFHMLIADGLFYLPFISDWFAWHGSRPIREMKQLMIQGHNISLIPGGFEEATILDHGKHKVYLNKRKGFIKYALRHNYSVRPAYTFGEELTYYTVTKALQFRLALNKYKIPGVVFWTKLGFLPHYDLDLVTVVGKPLELPHLPNPTDEQVIKYHDMFVERLRELFEKYKTSYAADPKATLEVY